LTHEGSHDSETQDELTIYMIMITIIDYKRTLWLGELFLSEKLQETDTYENLRSQCHPEPWLDQPNNDTRGKVWKDSTRTYESVSEWFSFLSRVY
jgi:hypothetical protein